MRMSPLPAPGSLAARATLPSVPAVAMPLQISRAGSDPSFSVRGVAGEREGETSGTELLEAQRAVLSPLPFGSPGPGSKDVWWCLISSEKPSQPLRTGAGAARRTQHRLVEMEI